MYLLSINYDNRQGVTDLLNLIKRRGLNVRTTGLLRTETSGMVKGLMRDVEERTKTVSTENSV